MKVREDTFYNNNRKLSRPTSTSEIHRVDAEQKSGCSLFFPVIETRPGFGVPQHYGVFYSLGLALVMEGLLSAAYHVCPNQNNFQFGTCLNTIFHTMLQFQMLWKAVTVEFISRHKFYVCDINADDSENLPVPAPCGFGRVSN